MLAALVLSSSHATAGEFLAGNDLHNTCTEKDHLSVAACAYYIAGVVDASELFVLLEVSSRHFCLPPEASTTQTADVVRRYLANHPEKRHNSASSLSIVALAEAFPCPN